jgi:hypothetical protein
MRDRMIAGRVANAIIFDAAGFNPKLPKGCEGFAIKQLIQMAMDDLERADGRERRDAENAEQRIWREGLAVVHLAAAAQAYLNTAGAPDEDISFGDFIWNQEAILWIANQADLSFRLMQNHPDRFRWRRRPIVLQIVD